MGEEVDTTMTRTFQRLAALVGALTIPLISPGAATARPDPVPDTAPKPAAEGRLETATFALG
jgi:hypothetical protein